MTVLDADLAAWIEASAGPLRTATQLVGGNRRQAWAIDCAGQPPLFLRLATGATDRGADIYTLVREAKIYQALQGRGVAIPRLIALHPTRPAMLVERAPGRSRFAALRDAAAQNAVARDFIHKLAALHKLDAATVNLPIPPTMRAAVAEEISHWRAMYEETARPDPLIDFSLAWLDQNLPNTPAPAILVHGDAGPGNFLYEHGHVTALIDWELSHSGDPMEDFAWLSMRTTLEPFPDFPALLCLYAELMGRPIARARLLYHRVFVPLRVVIIRHRALSEAEPDGDRANSLISRTLNRRLLVEALHEATNTPLPPPPPNLPATPQPEYDYVLALLRDKIAARTQDEITLAAAKSAARMVKFLAATQAHGQALAAAHAAASAALLGMPPAPQPELDAALHGAILHQRLPVAELLKFFAGQIARETQLTATTMGALATRPMPRIE